MTNLYGRERDLSRIGQGLSRAVAGEGALVLVTGEPGIGKSAFGKEVAARANAAGMRVLAGRCWESGGAAPYWPWVQIFRALGKTPFEELARDDGGDAQQRRFQLFDAAARALITSGQAQPLCLFVDDLHAADVPSLLLLLFLARQLAGAPLFLLTTAREVESRRAPEAAEVIAKIGREGDVLSLARLAREDVAAWVAAADAAAGAGPASTREGADAAAEVFRVTEGNPLFVSEMLRVGARGARGLTIGGTTDGMKAALDEHLRKAAPETRAVLEVAAVLGRDFGSRELAAVADVAHDAVWGHLRAACELGVLEAVDRDRFQFTHVLLRDRLYDLLPPERRSALHWSAGLHAQARGAHASRVATHLLDGAGAGDVAHAAASALHASEGALQALAFEAAVELADRGRALVAEEVSLLACRLDIASGEGLMRSGAVEAGRARCVRAAGMARDLGGAEEQARAALTYGSELTGDRSVNAEMVGLLEQALAASGPEDSPLSAKLRARLATALTPPRGMSEAEQVREVALGSLAMARRLGHAETLLYSLDHARNTVGYMIPSDERFALIREAVALAQVLEQRLTLIKIGPAYAVGLLERGLRADADAVLAAMVDLHAALDYPPGRWRLAMLRAGFALFDGRLDEAELLGDEAVAVAVHAGTNAARFERMNQRLALAIAGGNPASIGSHAASILPLLERNMFSGPHRAWVLAVIGRSEEAARQLRAAMAIEQALPTLLIAGDACALLRDPTTAAVIADQLDQRSFGAPFFWGGVGAYAFGPTPRVRGELARLLGRPDEARRHFEDAIALCGRIGAKPFLALSIAALARLDAETGRPGHEVGAPPPSPPQSAAPAPASAHASPAPRPRTIALSREGDIWAIGPATGPAFRLKHSKGLGYLSELVAHPGQDLHVLALVGLEHGAGDAGPVLDARAKAAYRQRIEALEDELAEAEGYGDGTRASRAQAELDALGEQLAGALGLGGRDRRAASDVERARINVQRRLKDAIASIEQENAELGRYLGATVKTGTYCSFTPL